MLFGCRTFWNGRLYRMMRFLSRSTEKQFEDPRQETQAKFGKYFAESGMRGFYAVPLADDDGRVGTLSFESSDPDFLGPAHLEMIKILSAQATVALRNASLYREVPFIDLLKPVLDRKRKFLALEKRRRALLVAGRGRGTAVPADLSLCRFGWLATPR